MLNMFFATEPKYSTLIRLHSNNLVKKNKYMIKIYDNRITIHLLFFALEQNILLFYCLLMKMLFIVQDTMAKW